MWLDNSLYLHYLEQLRIAVRLQEREAAALAAYLAKPPRPTRR